MILLQAAEACDFELAQLSLESLPATVTKVHKCYGEATAPGAH